MYNYFPVALICLQSRNTCTCTNTFDLDKPYASTICYIINTLSNIHVHVPAIVLTYFV